MYGKLFSQMYDGTLATNGPWESLVTFQQLIILADKNGVIDMTAEAIARRTTIPLEIIVAGIAALEQPDPDSRTPTEEGRRIARLSESRTWGWQIVNYQHYRNLRSAEERRIYHQQYYHDKRKTKHVSTLSTDSTKAVSSKHKQGVSGLAKSSTRSIADQNPLGIMLKKPQPEKEPDLAQIERNRAIAQAVATGNNAEAERLHAET